MKIIFIDYPTNFSFSTNRTFNNNDERTEYLHQVLSLHQVNSPSHDYSDYVVEYVEPIGKVNEREFWLIGS
jgi:hypothetical protein